MTFLDKYGSGFGILDKPRCWTCRWIRICRILGGKLYTQAIFSFAGGIADAVLSGDLKEQGLGKTLFYIGVSIGLSAFAGSIGEKIASKIKGNSLSKLSRHAIKKRFQIWV